MNTNLAKEKLTSGSLLARNTFFNLIGQGIPLLAALFAIPLLIHGLGTDRFGVLILAWMVIGYFSLFDLGLGRALTQLMANKLGTEKEGELPTLVWTSLILMVVLGAVGAVIMSLVTPLLVHDVLKVPEALQAETLQAFWALAVSIPIVISTTGLIAILEAQQHFGLINAVRAPLGVFTFLGPLLTLPFSNSLFVVVLVLLAGRLVAGLIYLMFCLRVMPALRHSFVFDRTVILPLIRFGSWMTVSNIIGPLMVTVDRLLIGSLISMASVAYYATPSQVVTNVGIIPNAIVGVLFPAFATLHAQDGNRAALLLRRGVKYTFLAVFPVIVLIVAMAFEGLNFWLGIEFAKNSERVLQILAVGVLFNSLAKIPFALVQGVGRPDITATLHFIELPFYLLAVWWLIGAYGIDGVAIAWTGRMAVDMLFLFSRAQRLLPTTAIITPRMALTAGMATLILVIACSLVGIALKGVFVLLTVVAFAITGWFWLLSLEERVAVQMFRNWPRHWMSPKTS